MRIQAIETIFIFLIFISILSVIVSAQFYYTPFDIFQNEWVTIIIVFAISFAFTFFALNKTLKGNTGVAVIIAAGIAFFITSAFSKQPYITDYFGGWGFTIAVIIGLVFLLKAAGDNLGAGGTILVVLILYGILIFNVDRFEASMPYEITNSSIYRLIISLTLPPLSWVILIILIIVAWGTLRRRGFSGRRLELHGI